MAATIRVKANRQNAKNSTGPKTPKGKAQSKFNAVKHGLTAQEVVIPGEDGNVFEEVIQQLAADLAPEGMLEARLVDEIAAGLWRLRRFIRVEAGIFTWNRYQIDLDRASAYQNDYVDQMMYDSLPHISNEKAEATAKRVELRMQDAVPTLGMAFVKDASDENALGKLTRYETAARRALYQALHEFQRLQAARGVKTGLAPAALDISVDMGSGESSPNEQLGSFRNIS